uniref:Ribosome biogenesis regulatory protein n=1 Tax=Erpetoichthys calabaricus TaxID=27687 RepID=A0A8C4X655_ERPCA
MAACSIEDVLAKVEKDEAEILKNITVHKELELEFDIGNLAAFDKNPADVGLFRKHKKEEFLRSLARDNTQLLINEMWKLPTERVQEAVVAKLPEPHTRLPREKPLPKPRPPTKWEEFAKLKGIPKKKKTNLVWDDVHKEWRRRWGYKRAKDDTKDWLIEVPESADPNEDQFARRLKAKNERVAKNELNRLKNIARGQKVSVQVPPKDQSKAELGKAMQLARISTASVGKFQDKLPKEKPTRTVGKKRSFQPLIGDFNMEKQRQLDLLKVMENKKPRMNVTRAVNRQMREEDAEAARHKKEGRRGGKGGKKKGRGGGGKGRGGPKSKKHHGK